MAKDLNRVTVSGRLPRDGEIRVTPNGLSVATFTIASGRSIRDGDGWKDETEWFRVVAWRDLAERYSERLKKGAHVLVEGRLQTRKWTDPQTNQERQTTEVVANDIYMMGPSQQRAEGGSEGGDDWDSVGNGGGGGNQRNAGQNRSNGRSSQSSNQYDNGMEPEDIPF